MHAFLFEPGTHGLADSQRTRISGNNSGGSGGGGLYVVCVSETLGSSYAGGRSRDACEPRERKASL